MPFVFVAFTKVVNNWKGIMKYATLGNTGLLVSKLWVGLSAGRYEGSSSVFSPPDKPLWS